MEVQPLPCPTRLGGWIRGDGGGVVFGGSMIGPGGFMRRHVRDSERLAESSRAALGLRAGADASREGSAVGQWCAGAQNLWLLLRLRTS